MKSLSTYGEMNETKLVSIYKKRLFYLSVAVWKTDTINCEYQIHISYQYIRGPCF